MRFVVVALLAYLLAMSAAASALPTPPPGSAVLAADTPGKTPSGAIFTGPKDWWIRTTGKFVVLTAPEGDTHVAIVDVGKAADAGKAAALAWSLYAPQAHHPVDLITALAVRDGWDERKVVEYETSPNEQLSITAESFRSGSNWTVVIVDGHNATAEKRGAAIGLIFQSLRPAGYKRETFAGLKAHAFDPKRVAELTSFVQTSMRELDVPGVAIALVDRGAVVFDGGFGVRELGKPEPVDAHTLFMIASNTKGMSTLLLAKLVDEGKVSWDEPVTQAYPGFRLGDDATTKQVLIRHLVCACTGLPRKDFEWILNTAPGTPASSTFAQLAATQPTSGFGQVFQYNNLMASAAGYIAGHLTYPDLELGAAYDAAMQNLIFDPLGMHETTFDMARAQSGDHASPHGEDVDGHTVTAGMALNDAIVPYRPAGGAWSSAYDMIKYVQDELALGRLPDGTQLVSAKNLLVRRAPGVPVGEDAFYGMGLIVDTRWGIPVVDHGGDLVGFHSNIIFLPDAGVGAVILTNSDNGAAMRAAFTRRLVEIMYDGKPQAAAQVAAAAAQIKAETALARRRLVVPAAPALAAALAARYTNPDLGHIDVIRKDGKVIFDFGALQSEVASRVNDDKTVSFITIDPGLNGFEFVVSDKDGHRGLITRDGQHEYDYAEAP